MKKEKWIIRDREAGNVIEECDSEAEALAIIKEYEKEDKQEGYFKGNFYEAVLIEE